MSAEKTPEERLEGAIVELLGRRGPGKTICPSEASRAVFGNDEGLSSAAMVKTRAAARRLVDRGVIDVTQRGHVVDPKEARGPIRLRLRRGVD